MQHLILLNHTIQHTIIVVTTNANDDCDFSTSSDIVIFRLKPNTKSTVKSQVLRDTKQWVYELKNDRVYLGKRYKIHG